MISGIITASLMFAFIVIVFWAWSSRNRARFAEAASLPLQDERGQQGTCCCKEPRK